MMAFIGVRISWLMLGQEGAARGGGGLGLFLGLQQGVGQGVAGGDVGQQLGDAQGLATGVQDGAEGGARHSSSPCLTRAWHSRLAKSPRCSCCHVGGLGVALRGVQAEQVIVLALHLVQAVAEHVEEVLVGVQHVAVQAVFDDRHRTVDGGHRAFEFGVARLGLRCGR